jgi:hypothetical protein
MVLRKRAAARVYPRLLCGIGKQHMKMQGEWAMTIRDNNDGVKGARFCESNFAILSVMMGTRVLG